MRKLLFSSCGAVLAGILCNILFWGAGKLAIILDIRLYNGEEESARNFLIFLFAFLTSIIAGGIYGFYLANNFKKTHND